MVYTTLLRFFSWYFDGFFYRPPTHVPPVLALQSFDGGTIPGKVGQEWVAAFRSVRWSQPRKVSKDIKGLGWLLMVINGYWWLLMVINGY